jgi:Taurine catabolism dioxygenase TauD, TfdA family
MAYETVEVKPVTATIGAEIFGIDLGRPLGNQQFQEVHDALMAHQVIFFRDQKLSFEQHKAFGRLFGELHIHPNTPGPDGHPEILPIHADANSKRISGELALGCFVRSGTADGIDPQSQGRATGRWRHDLCQHVCRV